MHRAPVAPPAALPEREGSQESGLRRVYTAPHDEAAERGLATSELIWGEKFPRIAPSSRAN